MNMLSNIINNEINKFLNENDYRGEHQAPDVNDSPMYDLTNTYPDDIYSYDAARLYAIYGDNRDSEAINIIQSARNKPNKLIKIYRAVPIMDENLTINNGDWVTINRDYAKQHAESNIDGQYEIVSKTVPAQNLYTDGNSIFEWGYYKN